MTPQVGPISVAAADSESNYHDSFFLGTYIKAVWSTLIGRGMSLMLSYAIKNQLVASKPPKRGFGTLAPRWFFMA